jgi:hypothetical protein
MARRFPVVLAVIAAAAATCGPPAWAAKPRLYKVSLSGDARSEAAKVVDDAVYAPEGCVGTMSETHRFTASAGLAPKPRGVPVASYGRLRFQALLKSPAVTATTETAGSFAPDPNDPPADPSVCAVAPATKSWACSFASEATRSSGAEFALLPNKGRYELYYNRSGGLVSCDDEFPLNGSLLDVAAPKLTQLRVRAVKRLRKGGSVSVSGTATSPAADSTATGGETLAYTLKVKRVR